MTLARLRRGSTLGAAALLLLCAVRATAQERPPEPSTPELPYPELPPEPVPPHDVTPEPLPGAPAEPTFPPPTPDGVTVQADRVAYDPATHSLVAEGGVMVLAPDRTVAATSATLDLRTGVLHAKGPIVMADANQVVTCASADLDLRNQSGTLRQVRTESREPMDRQTRAMVARLGRAPPGPRTAITTGQTVTIRGPSELSIDQAYLTTCDCKSGSAPWSVRARRAEVSVGRYAVVHQPTVYVYDMPVLPLPFWVVPLGQRQSGLLFPEIRFQDGLWLTQPLYLTLGESADVTVGPGIVLERGPRLQLEARAAPQEDTHVEWRFFYQYDRKHLWQRRTGPAHDVPLGLDVAGDVEQRLALRGGKTETGETLVPHRFASRFVAGSVVHGVSLAADLNHASDKHVPGDFGGSLGDRVAPYLRSAVALSHGSGHGVYSATLLTFQDLQQPDVALWGRPSAQLAHRMPSLRFRLLEAPLLTVPHLGTLLAARAQAGMDQEWVIGGDGTPWGRTREDFAAPGRQAGAMRLFMEPHLVAPLRLGRFGGIRLGAAVREAVFFSPESGEGISDVTRVLTYANAETEVTGRWAAPGVGGLTHRVRPWAGYQGVPWARHSGAPWPWLDESDRTARYHAVGAGLWNELAAGRLLGRRASVTTEIRAAQDLVDVLRREVSGRAVVHAEDFSSSLRMAVDPSGPEVTFLQTGLDVGGGERPQVHVGYTRVGPRPPRFMLGGAEELLGGLRLEGPIRDGPSDRLDAFLRVPVGRVWLDYGVEAAFPGLDLAPQAPSTTWRPRDLQPTLLTHGGGVSYESACRCWNVGARLRFWPGRQIPDAAVQLNIGGPGGAVKVF